MSLKKDNLRSNEITMDYYSSLYIYIYIIEDNRCFTSVNFIDQVIYCLCIIGKKKCTFQHTNNPNSSKLCPYYLESNKRVHHFGIDDLAASVS